MVPTIRKTDIMPKHWRLILLHKLQFLPFFVEMPSFISGKYSSMHGFNEHQRCHPRGVGTSTVTPALAVVDFGPAYLVGLLCAILTLVLRHYAL